MSIDPMADKYPSLSPYIYCADNPVILVDPDGREIGWYLDRNGTIIGRDKNNDDRLYLVLDKFDIQKIKSDNYLNGITLNELRGDVSEVPSYDERMALKELWELGRNNLGTEYGIVLYRDTPIEQFGYRLVKAKEEVAVDASGIKGKLDFSNCIFARPPEGNAQAQTIRLVGHTHNINDGNRHPPTIGGDKILNNQIGIIFDYVGYDSHTYIYNSKTRYRNDSYMKTSDFFKSFKTPIGKEL